MTIMSHLKDLKDDFHSDTVLSILNEQRIRGILCDVTIIVEDTKFKAHSNVLAASSLYFKNIFWSHTICISGHVLELDGLKAEVFTEILNYIYSSTVIVKKQESVVDLAAAGKKLGISFLEDLTEKSLSGSPCLYSFCNTEKNDVKEEKRQEDSAVTNGPRITNAYSIFETENSNNLFSPLDLRASFKKMPETNKASNSDLDRTDACKEVERASTLAEHSYAVTTGCNALQQNSFYYENTPLYKTGEDCSEAAESVPLVKSTTQSYNAPKARFNSQITDAPTVKISVHKGSSSEAPHKVIKDHSHSFQKSQPNKTNILSSKEDENKSDNLSGSIATDIPHSYNCNCCTKSFNDKTQLSTHLKLHSQSQETSICKYCSKQFENIAGLETHEQACRGLNNFCIENENEQNNLDNFVPSNEKTGTSYVSPEPTETENEFTDYPATNGTMPETDHFVKVVGGQILYTCSVCKRTYVTLSSLRRHSNVHSWRRTYPCHYCNKVFALAEYRTRHEIWHTGERRYQCIFCLETFMTYYILKNHQKSFHAIDHRLGVNKKTANGGLKPNVYPYKLYRLLPMKCKRAPYKSYGNSSYERVQVNEVPSSTCIIQNTVNSELASLNFEHNMLPSSSISLDSSSCGDATATSENPPNVSSWKISSRTDLNNNSPTNRRTLSSVEDSGPQEYDSSRQTITNSNSHENSTSVISYNNSASSVIMHSGRVSSVIMHSNAVNAVGRSDKGTPDITISQVASNDLIHESDNGNSRTRSNKEKKKLPLYDRETTSKEVKYTTNTGIASNTPAHIFETSSKTETYIAKPALPGTSADSNVAPLCQITVKIGNEAIVKRHILGSKLFYKKGRRSKYESKGDQTVQVAEREKRERSLSRVCPSDYIESEMGDDVSDHDSNDKPWRPYYNYKPKKKSKQLRKMRKAKWREKYRSRKSCQESEKAYVTTYALRNIPEEKVYNQEEKMPDLNCKLCERENASTEISHDHSHRETTEPESFTCDLCQKHFQSSSTLRMHKRCHTEEKPYLCKTCGKGFSISSNLQKHERTHSAVKDFICQHCNKAFTLNETLKIHERIHTGEKRYHCQFCFQSFLYLSTKRNHEQRHKREHTGKGYACFQCPKVCKTAAALGMHQKKHLFKPPKQEDRKDCLFNESSKSCKSQHFFVSEKQETAKPLLTKRITDAEGNKASNVQNTALDSGL